MRIKYLLYKTFVSSSLIALVSCGGDSTLLSPYVPDDSGPFNYEIKGLRDTFMERIGETRYMILVDKLSGKSEDVLLSGQNLPDGMEVYFDPVNNAQPSFNTGLVIRSKRVKEGTHRINIRGASPTSGLKDNFIEVTIKPYTNHADGLVGGFTETGLCSPSGNVNDNVNIIADETVKNRIHIKGLFSGVMTNIIYADLDPATNTLVIPSQVQNFLTYEGDGTFDDDKIVINYTIKGAVVDETCTSTLQRQ